MLKKAFYTYLSDRISFQSNVAAEQRLIYFPLCGADAAHIKSAITPFLGGDIKMDRHRYLTKPSSREDLRGGLRKVFITSGEDIISLTDDCRQAQAQVTMGQLWHQLSKTFPSCGLRIEALNFVPVKDGNMELMKLTITNLGDDEKEIQATIAIPIFGRALENKHDHEHVTALLHRVEQIDSGVIVVPTMSFNEEGHKNNQDAYFVLGICEQTGFPAGSFPTVDEFVGDTGTLQVPEAVYQGKSPRKNPQEDLNGKEAVGALQFQSRKLAPKSSAEYVVAIGTTQDQKNIIDQFARYDSPQKVDAALKETQDYWKSKSHSIMFQTGDADFNSWMQWVTLQPVLRRIYGCSFLPDHDYGKGGKGWRDIWQDLLSLILIEPLEVRKNLVNNFAGVRVDGSNATIIGSAPGEFIADRNAISRVWMDHGVWPFSTLLLYIHQTGDTEILFEKISYFRDPQFSRNFSRDWQWTPKEGNQLKSTDGGIYKGTILEHVLVQHLVQYYNVGDHGNIRLENADWNDGLDMGFDQGESVAFTSFYAGNLSLIAELLVFLKDQRAIKTLEIYEELGVLLNSKKNLPLEQNPAEKRNLIFETYFPSVQPCVSGKRREISVDDLIEDLRLKSQRLTEHLQNQEWISEDTPDGKFEWFNGYYDNQGQRVEGTQGKHVQMTLTGQVFPIMSGSASEEMVKKMVQAADQYLKDPQLKSYRLNTNFHRRHYLDLGRAFGFAYGTKENGAFFCHMIVMYAYALYSRGFVREGYQVIKSIYDMCMDTDHSKIYPGIPEYFDSQGRGMYHYLTGSASWLVLTELTQVFGIRGRYGDLLINPKLVSEQFNSTGEAGIETVFNGVPVRILYRNPKKIDAKQYKIHQVAVNGQIIDVQNVDDQTVLLKKELLEKYSRVEIDINLA
ncbi:MAG: cellobiose phosphorylase [Candidatus Omnitrophica bacterium]|nr:cellobiose phosphorylase [Candidatus Omnitrophota bacterium]